MYVQVEITSKPDKSQCSNRKKLIIEERMAL